MGLLFGNRHAPPRHHFGWVGLALALIIAACCTPAPARAEAGSYLYWSTATAIDDNCHYLKAVERHALADLRTRTLALTADFASHAAGELDDAGYQAYLDRTDAAAAQKVTELGCEGDAHSYLLTARDYANRLIVQQIMLALHFDGLPPDDPESRPIVADAKQALFTWLGFVQQVYGESYTRFETEQRTLASQQLASVSAAAQPVDADATEIGRRQAALWALRGELVDTVARVHFEVAAESAGYRIWPERVGGQDIDTLHPANTTEAFARLVTGPSSFDTAAGPLHFVLVETAFRHQLWVMTWGDAAQGLAPGEGQVAALVAPEDHVSWYDDAWRDGTARFDATRLEATCLGGPCWQLPDAARTALLAAGPREGAELWFALAPDAAPSPQSDSAHRTPITLAPLVALATLAD